MAMVRLIYYSQLRIDGAKGPIFQQLNEILDASNRNNEAKGITGALIFDSNWFVQVLEGALNDVWSTFKSIEHDERHVNVSFVGMTTVPSRRFGDWWMGCAERVIGNAQVFAPYLYNGRFQPANMASDMILSLMEDLSSSSGCFARKLVGP